MVYLKAEKMNGSVAGKGYAVDGAWMVFGNAIVDAALTGPERKALYADVTLVQREHALNCAPPEPTMKEAAELLKLRIGGAQNLRPYVDTLMAGIKRANKS